MLRRQCTKILTSTRDSFGGVVIGPHDLKQLDSKQFSASLKESMKLWRSEGVKGVWIHIPIEQAELISIAASEGFQFHHSQQNYLMMTNWIPKDEPNRLPHYCTHTVGCGGAVIDRERSKILLVSERHPYQWKQVTTFGGDSSHNDQNLIKWKIPGGALDSQEHIEQCVSREIFEETGIKSKFEGILGFRLIHNFRYKRDDIYFACILSPETMELNPDPKEVEHCEWISLEDYFCMKHLHAVQMEIMENIKSYLKGEIQIIKSGKDITQFENKKALWYSLPMKQ